MAAAEAASGSKLDKWLSRSREANPAKSAPAPAPAPASGKVATVVRIHKTPRGVNTVQTVEAAPAGWDEVTDGWGKIMFHNGQYEGNLVGGFPKGYGRCWWPDTGSAYHGEFEDGKMHGKGIYLNNATAERYEGEFANEKPCGKGVLTINEVRYDVEFDGLKGFHEGAEPLPGKVEAQAEVLTKDSRFTVVAVSRGNKMTQFKGNYSHCRSVDAKLAYASPSRANKPLKNPQEIEGAVAVLVIGTDHQEKYTQIFQIHEGNPADDNDVYDEDEVAKPVTASVPVAYALGRHEELVRHGAFVRLRFFPGAPNVPDQWLLGCILIHPQTVHRDLTRDEGDKLLSEFLNVRKEERRLESAQLETKLRRKGNSPQKDSDAPEMKGREWASPLMMLMEPDDGAPPSAIDNFMRQFNPQDVLDLCQDIIEGNYASMTVSQVPIPFKLDTHNFDMSSLAESLSATQRCSCDEKKAWTLLAEQD